MKTRVKRDVGEMSKEGYKLGENWPTVSTYGSGMVPSKFGKHFETH